MDGFQKRLNASIALKLSVSLSATILVVAIVAGVLSFVSAFGEAHELQDETLGQVAALFDRHRLSLPSGGEEWQAKGSDEESRVIVRYLAGGPRQVDHVPGGNALPIPTDLADGLHTLEMGGTNYRILVKTTADGSRIAIGQETEVRDEIARNGAFRTLLPFLVLVPILILMVVDLIRKMFRPITVLSADIDQRADQDMQAIPQAHLPIEVRPFVVAINHLLNRVAQAMDAQTRFVADAAHELRSPLTAMSLQAQRLAEADMSKEASQRLAALQQGIERSRRLQDQLLTLAKAQTSTAPSLAPVSIQAVFRHVLEDLVPLADAKQIDIGVDGQQDALVAVNELDLLVLVKNLVDNAIRYTPDGGRVDLSLSVQGGNATVQVRDTGPGIPVSERQRVFAPFYRTLGSGQLGSGLGLSIVQAICQRIGATLSIHDSDPTAQTGLCVEVVLAGVL